LAILFAGGRASGAPPSSSGAIPGQLRPADAGALLDRLESAWAARDREAWLALWDFADPGQRAAEEDLIRTAFGSDETLLTFVRRPQPTPDATRLTADVQVFVASEPRASVDYWRLGLEKRDGRWALVSREAAGQVDGLVHLSLGPRAWRARGVSLRLEDFELRMEDGTLFATPESLGPTGLVFVGRARVRFLPRPPAEREQLRQFAGTLGLDTTVSWSFIRVHPADYGRVLETSGLTPEPDPGRRRGEAERVWRARAERSFIVDASLPRSPWWLMPGLGDAVVDFPFRRGRVLTFALSNGEPEDVNLFDRDRRLQICTYPSGGRPARYSEDDRRTAEILSNDLTVRFEPDSRRLQAACTMRLRLLAPASTLRLRLHDDFQVSSVTSNDRESLLFLRVREQGHLVISLGPNAYRAEPFALTVRYAGRHDPSPIDQEIVQVMPPSVRLADEGLLERPPLVYSNRTAWYPRPTSEEFAPLHARFDTPEGWIAVTGGELLSSRTEAGRVLAEYRLQQPGKYVTAIVGRFEDMGLRQEDEQAVRGFATQRVRGDLMRQMQKAEALLAFYGERFGPCPYPVVNLAVAEGEAPGGHSPPGLAYLQQRPPILLAHALPDDPANFVDLPGFFLAHELAHQWWGQGVAPANYRERWLSEAWAQYAAALWIRRDRGEDAFRSMMDRMARWALRFDSAGPIHLGQRLGHLKGDPRIFRSVVYDKGAWVLHMLRGLLGDEAFFGGARAFLERHRYAKAGTDDLRKALEQASGRDLTPYFERWIYGTGLPTLAWSSRTETTARGSRTTVEVRPEALPGPLPLEIAVYTDDDGREARRVMLDPAGGSWTIDAPRAARRVELNADRGLLVRLERVRRLPESPAQR
jgi:hypothetical protein